MTAIVEAPPKKRILIVEDEPIVAMDLSAQLEQIGYEICATEETGRAAIAAVHEHLPDIVLMDIVIKGDMDGIETARHIGKGLQVPVVFLTAFSDPTTVERAALAAPHGYLTKPFQTKELRAVIEVALYKALLERNLRESELWFASTLRCVGDCVIATDSSGYIRFMNATAEALTGWGLDQAKHEHIDTVFRLHDPKSGNSLPSFIDRVLIENQVLELDFGTLLENRDGRKIQIDDSAAPIRDHNGTVLGAVIVFRDVTARIETERTLMESEKRFRNTFDFAPIGMALLSLKGRFLQVNSALCQLLGYSTEELLQRNDSGDELAETNDCERQSLKGLLTDNEISVQFEKRFMCKSGKEVWTQVSVSLLKEFNTPVCYLYQVHDLTEQRAIQHQLSQLAHFDTLTGLVNRARLRIEVEQLLAHAERDSALLAVVFIDLDHFKEINDTLGHEAGDILLKMVAERLKHTVRASDCIARLGGDEFVLLLPDVNSAVDVGVVLEKVRVAMGEPIDINGYAAEVGISFGVSMYPTDGKDPTELFRCADSALYHAKAEGRNNIQFYREELTTQMEERLSITNALKHALERAELIVHYQPIMQSSPTPKLIGAEALLRWQHADRGFMLPDEFIAIAESTGLIAPIGLWVLTQACREAMRWRLDGKDLYVSVNVSPRQFSAPNFVTDVVDILHKTGLPAHQLCIEITEQFLMHDRDRHISVVAELKTHGVKIAIDDFGIGYSQLSYLRRFAPDILKIDRTFISDIETDEDDRVIVKAVLAMSRSLGMLVIAEGVETNEQLEFLKNEQCDFLQGYLFSKPISAEAFRLLHQSI